MKLEDLQKERLEEFNRIPMMLGSSINRDIVESFLSDSIRLAYEAGKHEGFAEESINCDTHSKSALKEGFRAGLERAKELIPEIWPKETPSFQKGWDACRSAILSAIDAEITKNKKDI